MKPEIEPILERLGISSLNEMQLAASSAITDNKETLLLAPTGSGKTLAFLLPVLSMLDPDFSGVQCVVIVPSRELALQIEQVWRKMSTGFKITCCYGGHDMPTEIRSLSEPPAMLVATPGRLLDHIHRKSISIGTASQLVLDEFDKSLELGFKEEMKEIFQSARRLKRKVLVSATKALEVPSFVGFQQPVVVDFISEQPGKEALQFFRVDVGESDQVRNLYRLLGKLGQEQAIVFCNRRDEVAMLGRELGLSGVKSAIFHGEMEQADRERSLSLFRNGSSLILIATDLAARGLDIPDVRHVIHYELPVRREDFVHRNGRTARMEATGCVYLFLRDGEQPPAFVIEKLAGVDFPKKGQHPAEPNWVTIHIGGGKKDKLSKADIAGYFFQKGGLEKTDLGLIEVKDTASLVAVKRDKAEEALEKISSHKIKGKKFKVGFLR